LDEFQDVDGVFASGYSMAQVLYETAQQRNIDIPKDLQIVSYDGAFRQWNNNRLLTCVEQPIEDMARAVVQLLIDKINDKEVPDVMTLPMNFVVGATTK
jgi:DNA-binding LacI/PurR family transcriptional regulator